MTDKPIPMTREEEYRNADVPMPKEDDRGELDLTKMIEVQQKEIRNLVKDNQLLIAEIDRLRGQIERLKNLITNA
jgi:peptidoglycan hydrolase CwlO-like protein|tara:strand:- start:341 stop:565 length:225 start_codon:yes stop_codon:yes gene_type:complete